VVVEEDSCLDMGPDDVEEVVVETALHPAMEVASFLEEEGLLEVVVALEACDPFGPSLVPCCSAAVAVVVAAVKAAAAVELMREASEATVVVRPC
jgi:hypothetical protein